jgi:hypothetical protein
MVPICPIGGAQHKAYPASSPDPYAPWLDSHKTYYGIYFVTQLGRIGRAKPRLAACREVPFQVILSLVIRFGLGRMQLESAD